MSLDVTLIDVIPTEVYEANITHNLAIMAKAAGIYYCLWRPNEIGIKKAGELVAPLELGVKTMKTDVGKFEALNPSNGWELISNLFLGSKDISKPARKTQTQ